MSSDDSLPYYKMTSVERARALVGDMPWVINVLPQDSVNDLISHIRCGIDAAMMQARDETEPNYVSNKLSEPDMKGMWFFTNTKNGNGVFAYVYHKDSKCDRCDIIFYNGEVMTDVPVSVLNGTWQYVNRP